MLHAFSSDSAYVNSSVHETFLLSCHPGHLYQRVSCVLCILIGTAGSYNAEVDRVGKWSGQGTHNLW